MSRITPAFLAILSLIVPGAVLAQSVPGSAPDACTAGVAVTLTDGTTGVIQSEPVKGFCMVQITAAGDVTVAPLTMLRVAAGSPWPEVPLPPGPYTCRGDGRADQLRIEILDTTTYRTQTGETGAFEIAGEADFKLVSGPYGVSFGYFGAAFFAFLQADGTSWNCRADF